MTIQSYINSLIADGLDISRVKITSYYQFSGSSIGTNSGQIAVEIFSNEDESLCDFLDQSGNLVARAKSFASVI